MGVEGGGNAMARCEDGGEGKGGREELEVAEGAGERREGTVGADGEHIQPKLANAMIEVKITGCREADGLAYQKTV